MTELHRVSQSERNARQPRATREKERDARRKKAKEREAQRRKVKEADARKKVKDAKERRGAQRRKAKEVDAWTRKVMEPTEERESRDGESVREMRVMEVRGGLEEWGLNMEPSAQSRRKPSATTFRAREANEEREVTMMETEERGRNTGLNFFTRFFLASYVATCQISRRLTMHSQ